MDELAYKSPHAGPIRAVHKDDAPRCRFAARRGEKKRTRRSGGVIHSFPAHSAVLPPARDSPNCVLACSTSHGEGRDCAFARRIRWQTRRACYRNGGSTGVSCIANSNRNWRMGLSLEIGLRYRYHSWLPRRGFKNPSVAFAICYLTSHLRKKM